MTPWWLQKPMRMIQTNLREIDATLDVDTYIQSLKEFSADVVLFNVGGIYYVWYTKGEGETAGFGSGAGSGSIERGPIGLPLYLAHRWLGCVHHRVRSAGLDLLVEPGRRAFWPGTG